MTTHYKIDEPILTIAQVMNWQRRMLELTSQVHDLQEEIAGLGRKLDAAKVLMGGLPMVTEAPKGEPAEIETANEENIADAVLTAVDALGDLPSPAQIREWIWKEKPTLVPKMKRSPNYFYTVLLRHVQKKRLIKVGSGYRRVSPHGETGAVAAPASH